MVNLTPDNLAAPGTEHAIQTAFFCALASPHAYLPTLDRSLWPLLQLCYAIPSGGARDVVTAGRLKAEGVRAGIPDTHFPVARHGYHSMYIEFKKPDRQFTLHGGLSNAQVQMRALLEAEGNLVAISYGWKHAVEILLWYLAK